MADEGSPSFLEMRPRKKDMRPKKLILCFGKGAYMPYGRRYAYRPVFRPRVPARKPRYVQVREEFTDNAPPLS